MSDLYRWNLLEKKNRCMFRGACYRNIRSIELFGEKKKKAISWSGCYGKIRSMELIGKSSLQEWVLWEHSID